LWNVGTRKPIATLAKHKGWCRSVAITPDGKHIASAGEDGQIIIWSVSAKGAKEVRTIKKAHASAVYQVTFSPDGGTLASASTDKLAKLFDWKAGKEKAQLKGHTDAVWAVTYDKSGKRLATASADRSVRIWDASGKPQAVLSGHRDWVSSVAFSKDGKMLATGSLDRTVKIWNLAEAMKLSGQLVAAKKAIMTSRAGGDKAGEDAEKAQKALDTAKGQQKKFGDIVAAYANVKKYEDEQVKVIDTAAKAAAAAAKKAQTAATKAQAAANKKKKDKKLAAAAKATKAAATKAAAASTVAQKPLAAARAKAGQITKLSAASVKKSTMAKGAADKAVTAATNSLKAANAKKKTSAAAEKAAKAKSKTLLDKMARTIGGYKSTVWSVAFSPDSSSLATGSHKAVRIFSVKDWKERFPAKTATAKKKPAATKK